MDIPALLMGMDVGLLLPRHNEGLSNSILEYMAAGLPVICTDCGGNAELVHDGVNGIVVGVGDDKGVTEALVRLSDEVLRKKMGKAGRKRIEITYNQERVLDAFEQLYKDIVS